MDDLVQHVLATLRHHALVGSGDTLVVAVSGGPDSLCLLHVLLHAAPPLGVSLHVAHLDHMLRGVAASADANAVAQIAADWGVPFTGAATDVAALARDEHRNLHDAARVARYRFLAHVVAAQGAAAVAVAHTANDQAETVLMHLLRGAGTGGLSGMQLSSVRPAEGNAPPLRIIRPLLDTGRDDVLAYIERHKLQPRHDHTNDDREPMRNRIRHVLLPHLIEYNPHSVAALGRTAAICADDADFIEQALDQVWPQLVRAVAGALAVDGSVWQQLHPALQRAALRRLFAQAGGSATLSWERVEQARALAERQPGRQIEWPGGLRLAKTSDGLVLGARPENGPQLIELVHDLPVPGMLDLADGWQIVCRQGVATAPVDHWEAWVDPAALSEPLLVRRRVAGDRMRPHGGVGRRLVQDLLVDARVPRHLRAAWPLVATSQLIVWAPWLRVAEGYHAAPLGEPALHIRVQQR